MLRTRPVISTALSLALGALLVAPPAGAGPTGERVVNGDVSITRKGSKTRIVASDKSIIHWVTFDIARGEKVRFVQPSHDSTVLNRVLYASPTQIDGILRANGQVYIVNPSGIYFGGEAVVDVGRLVAVAGNLGDDDFVAGIDRFRDLSGEVENAGLLRGKEVALVGRRVANHGRIESRNGSLLMIAGDEVWLGRHGSNVLVQIGVLANPDGGAGPAVENTGVLDAGRGRVRMAAGDALGLAVRNHGTIRARRIALEGGRVEVGGSLDASNARAGRKGGVIAIRGDEITVDDALLDASGDRGGGKITIGGKVRGGGRHTARETVVGPDAELRADARERGDGGTVIVWADGNARIDGVISARGGSEGGDGGFVETSGKRHLAVSRAPDVTAPAGDGGTWLLDPANVTIVEEISEVLQGTERDLDEVADSPLGTPGPGDPRVVQPVAGSSEVTAGVIVDALSGGTNVVVTTEQFLELGEQGGNIVVNAEIRVVEVERAGSATLSLLAANDIEVNQAIVNVAEDFTLNVELFANDNLLLPASSNAVPGELLGGQPELSLADREVGTVTVAKRIKTGGGDVILQGVDVEVRKRIETKGGNVIVLAANPVDEADRDPTVGASRGNFLLTDTGEILTAGEDVDGSVTVLAGGSVKVRPNTEIQTGDGIVQISGRRMYIAGTLENVGGIGLGREAGIASGILFERTQNLELRGNSTVKTQGEGDLTLLGRNVETHAPIETTGGTFFVDATRYFGFANITATDVDIETDDILVLGGAIVSGERVDLQAGRNGTGNVELTDTILVGTEIDLRAGIGQDDLTQVKLLGTTAFLILNGGARKVLSLAQDASIEDDDIPTLTPLQRQGLDYRLESQGGSITLSSPDKVDGSALSLIAKKHVDVANTIVPETLLVQSSRKITVTSNDADPTTLDADRLRPASELVIHAGSDGSGDLRFESVATVMADVLTLRAGDGLGGNGSDAQVRIIQNPPDFADSAGTGNPDAFTLRQDADLLDERIPNALQFADLDVDELDYTLRSDDGRVEVNTPSKVENSDLTIVARNGIDLDFGVDMGGDDVAVTVNSVDLGGVQAFAVLAEHVSRVDLLDGGPERRVFRAGLEGTGLLTFVSSESEALVIDGKEIRLVASDLTAGTGTGSILFAEGLTFVGDADVPGSTPDVFVLRQDAAVDTADFPTSGEDGLFPNGLPPVQLIRSDENAITFDVGEETSTDGERLILSAADVTISRRDGDDLIFKELVSDKVEFRADHVSLEALAASGRPAIKAKKALVLSGFDPDVQEANTGNGEVIGLDTSPESFSMAQDGQLAARKLPELGSFLGGLDEVEYSISTTEGGIRLDLPERVEGTDLVLLVAGVAGDGEPELTIDFAGESFTLSSLVATTTGALTVTDGTTLDTDDGSIQILAGTRGQGDLTFEDNVVLTGRTIGLFAGDGTGGPDNNRSRVDATADDSDPGLGPMLRFTRELDEETELVIGQDARILGVDLPHPSQIIVGGDPPGIDNLDRYVIASTEGKVRISDFDRIAARNVIVESIFGSAKDPAGITIGNLDLTDLGVAQVEDIQLFSAKIVLKARAGEAVRADDPRLTLGRAPTGGAPATFRIRQLEFIADPDILPEQSQFAGTTSQMEYKIRSILGSVTLTPDAAEKVRGTRLTVQAARRITLNIEEAVDEVSASLGLASLRVVPGDRKRIDLNVKTDADNKAGIVTAGPQIYQGRVQLVQDAVLVASEIDFQGRVDSATSGPKSLVARASGRIRFDEDVGGKAPLRELELDFLTAVQPTGRAEFGSGRVHTTGDILINPDGRKLVTGVATVYSRTGDLIFETDSGNFVMGAGETATAIGTLAIRADDPDSIVIVADLNADRIEIAADTVGFVRRSSADVRVSGNAATPDGGSDINANEIDIDARVLATVGVGRDPVFGVPDPTQLPEFLAERPPGQRFAVVALKRDSTPLTSEDFTLTSGVVADWKPFGPTRADLSQVYWTPAPDPRVPPTLDDRVPESQALAAVGILSREPTRAEFHQRLEGAGIYDDRVGASVAEPRLFAARTGEAVELYQRLFGANLENAPRVREALQAALERYRRESPLPRVVGFEFRRWIKNRPSSQFEAYTTLEDLDALFHAHRNSGLSRFEYRRIQHEWLLAIQPHGIGLDELAEAIFPSRYVRGSDILDIFGQ